VTVTDPENEQRQLEVTFKGARQDCVAAWIVCQQPVPHRACVAFRCLNCIPRAILSPALAPFHLTDGWNSWTAVGDECDTTYEWEVVTSPGLTRVAAASSAINPANWEGCGGNSEDTRGCSFTTDVSGGLPGAVVGALVAWHALRVETALCTVVFLAGLHGLPAHSQPPSHFVTTLFPPILPPADGYYQVIVVAYNQYGFKRSEASNIVTVGAPSGNSQPLAVWAGDGDGKLSTSFPTPGVPAG